jgi:16S rRNA (adenine1518-N6/adenine1519-N6)-dimethyltransferase
VHPKDVLAVHHLLPKKSLGQNFLFDEGILRRIVAAGEVTATDEVLEVGPGIGSLTAVLAQESAAVTAIELDDRFIPILQNELSPYDNVTIVHGDILTENPADYFTKPYKVVANVPYYITGAILRHLLSSNPKPSRMVLTMQKEVAERITAIPSQMSLLAVSVQFYGTATIVDTIKAGAFWPRPKVDSAVIVIDLGETAVSQAINNGTIDEKKFFRLVKVGFAQKRKQLQKNLRALGYPRETIMEKMEQAAIAPNRRAQSLSIADWVRLYEAFEGN